MSFSFGFFVDKNTQDWYHRRLKMNDIKKIKLNPLLTVCGISLLIYAVLGNQVALPGYIRFLERGGTSAAGNAFDLAVVIGATKTILWMYFFQLGVLLLAIAHSIREALYTKHIITFGNFMACGLVVAYDTCTGPVVLPFFRWHNTGLYCA